MNQHHIESDTIQVHHTHVNLSSTEEYIEFKTNDLFRKNGLYRVNEKGWLLAHENAPVDLYNETFEHYKETIRVTTHIDKTFYVWMLQFENGTLQKATQIQPIVETIPQLLTRRGWRESNHNTFVFETVHKKYVLKIRSKENMLVEYIRANTNTLSGRSEQSYTNEILIDKINDLYFSQLQPVLQDIANNEQLTVPEIEGVVLGFEQHGYQLNKIQY